MPFWSGRATSSEAVLYKNARFVNLSLPPFHSVEARQELLGASPTRTHSGTLRNTFSEA